MTQDQARQYRTLRTPASARIAPAFSLIELLVVIGIIAVLLGILLPVIASINAAVSSARCKHHLSQLAMATALYAEANRDYYPQPSIDRELGNALTGKPLTQSLSGDAKKVAETRCWYNALDPYFNLDVKSYSKVQERNNVVYKQDPVWQSMNENPDDLGGNFNKTYKMNQYFGDPALRLTTNGYRFVRASAIRKPSATVVYFDGVAQDYWPDATIEGGSAANLFHGGPNRVCPRHSGNVNLSTADGAVASWKQPHNKKLQYHGWYNEGQISEDGEPLQALVWKIE